MKTSIHHRPKAYRNLYHARPIENRQEKEAEEVKYWKELKALVDVRHKAFWEKRGYSKPPAVSENKLFVFDLPSDAIRT